MPHYKWQTSTRHQQKKKLPLIKFREIQKQEKKAPEIKILMTF